MKIAKNFLIVLSLIFLFVLLLSSFPKGTELTKWEEDQKKVEQFQRLGNPAKQLDFNTDYSKK
jgi:hypothetical protein